MFSQSFRLPLGVALLLICTVSACLALENQLVDKALEPKIKHTEDWHEPVPPPSSAPTMAAAQTAPELGFGTMASATRQPQGALSGKIVFMNGGHGWTYDPGFTPPWRLLRGVGQEMNEDYGNVDQLNFFAMYCFNAGATVVPFRPLGQQTNAVILDNDDAAVTFSGSWSTSSSTIFFGSAGDPAYLYTSVADTETATATYTPSITVAGYYPVYTWVRAGSDRNDQLYRIRHTGGESQVRIPHYMVGNGWVYLGEYYFNAGSNPASGSVIISNLRGGTGAGSVVIADAIRFGNGMGATDTGGGGSGYPAEDESNRYWIRTSLGQGQLSTLYDGSGDDESDSWSAPPKMSAEMNREAAGDIFDRIHISFHSNAGGGRGTLGLITSDPTPYQSQLAGLAGREVNDDLVALGSPPLEVAWSDRTTVTYTGGYSEIDGSYFNYEMPATIIEVAFHDDVSDAKLLRDSKARAAVGRAAMHAVIKFMNQYGTNGVPPLAFLPEPPTNPRAEASGGNVVLSWGAPVSSGGSQAQTNYVVYRSTDGYGFGNPVFVGNTTSYTVTGLAPDTDYYFRISASNAGGESMPSEVVGCRISSTNGPAILVVNAFDRLDRFTNLRQDTTRQAYVPPDGSGTIERVWPRRVNAFNYVVHHGKAISAYGLGFDSCQSEQVANGAISLSKYAVVIWAAGNDSGVADTMSATEQSRLATYLANGGSLFVSGADVAGSLGGVSATASDKAFLAGYLHASLANSNSASYTAVAAAGSAFAGNANLTIDNGSRGIYWVQAADALTPSGGGTTAAMTYSGGNGGSAAIQYDGSQGTGRVIFFGFPFETISAASTRNTYMADALAFLLTPIPTNQPPRILADPQPASVLAGGTMTISAMASGSAPLYYQWRLNGFPISGANTNTYTRSNFQNAYAGNYDLVVTNGFGAVTSKVALLVATASPTLQAAFYDHFDTNSASRWTVNKSSSDTRLAFNYDYSGYGIPSAPGSVGGTTRGAKFEANMTVGAVAALNMSPTGGNWPGDCRLSYYLWINANGPFPAGGTGSTQHGTAGVGTAGNKVQWTSTGSTADGTWFAVDGEGQGSIDFYALSGATAYGAASGIYAAGTASDSRDNLNAYYAGKFPAGRTAPTLQQSAYAQQSGGLAAGTIGFTWRQVVITKQAGNVDWSIDGYKIASIPAASLPGNNFFIGYWDTFASISDNTNLSFGLVDNVKLETYVTNTLPYITSQPQPKSAKEGTDATFAVQAGGTPNLGYQWRLNGSSIGGANGSTYTRTNITSADQGLYSVVVTNAAGTIVSSSVALNVVPRLALKFDSAETLPDGSVILTLSGEPGSYTILESDDLAGWTAWTNVVIGTDPVQVTTTTTNATKKFFRAAQ